MTEDMTEDFETKVNPVDAVLARTGWTQMQLAEAVGVLQPAVATWKKRGFISRAHLLQVCKVSGFWPNELDEDAPRIDEILLARKYYESLER